VPARASVRQPGSVGTRASRGSAVGRRTRLPRALGTERWARRLLACAPSVTYAGARRGRWRQGADGLPGLRGRPALGYSLLGSSGPVVRRGTRGTRGLAVGGLGRGGLGIEARTGSGGFRLSDLRIQLWVVTRDFGCGPLQLDVAPRVRHGRSGPSGRGSGRAARSGDAVSGLCSTRGRALHPLCLLRLSGDSGQDVSMHSDSA